MNEWQKTRLGDLIGVAHGYSFDSAFFSEAPTNHILLTPANFKPGGGFDSSRYKYYDADRGPVPPRYILEPGDIIIALTDLGREGRILGCAGRVPGTRTPSLSSREGQYFLHNQRIGRVIPLPGKINTDFLYWLLRSKNYRSHILATASGSTVKHTSPRRIKEFCFMLPPPEEQTAAAALLNAVETRIHLLENSSVLLEQAAMNFFREWFTGSGEQKPQPLATFGKIVCGKTPSKEKNHYFGGPVPFIKIPDLRGRVYITHTVDSLSYEGAATQPRKQIPPNSICVSCIATVGLVAFTASWCHTNQQINSIIPHHHWNRYYLYCYLKTMGPQLEALSTGGSTTLNLNTGRFSRLPIPRPPQSLLEKFYRVVHPFFQRILLNTRHVERLIILRDSLLPKLIESRGLF